MAETVPGAAGAVGAPPRFALGIGLTNECNLSCAFCYRDPSRVDRLDLAKVRAVLDRLPVQSVNLGTGENGMHPRFREMLALKKSPLERSNATTATPQRDHGRAPPVARGAGGDTVICHRHGPLEES